ncbi:amino acid permease [Fulvitalea axinellae]|uniref:Amino acid permease n=1 Tax=Fulvitalea axinellae TaxID=1182444 RepID=A0AAU9C9X3_9BACT|nr:amino acid permease [Fulvitalea axinellae]
MSNDKIRTLGFGSTLAIVLASVIGTGIFTSVGLVAEYVDNPTHILLLWGLGGVMTLCGALCYAELGTVFPKSGGEYNALRKLYHPSLGFLFGWTSVVLDFPAANALTAIALAKYLQHLVDVPTTVLAAILVTAVTMVHAFSCKIGSRFQNSTVWLKMGLIVVFLVIGYFYLNSEAPMYYETHFEKPAPIDKWMIALLYVSYTFTGWSLAIYITDKVKDPVKTIPKTMVWGSVIITVLYLVIVYLFVSAVRIDDLKGHLDIGYLFSEAVLGDSYGKRFFDFLIAITLLSALSVDIWIGPQVSMAIGRDFRMFRWLGKINKEGVPTRGYFIQLLISLGFIFSSNFESVLLMSEFATGLFVLLTIVGVFIIRSRPSNFVIPYKTWGYPVTPLVFLVLSGAISLYILTDNFTEAVTGVFLTCLGLVFYWANQKYFPEKVKE